MSTRSTTHFTYGDQSEAIVYRHWDGYPESAGVDIQEFIKQCAILRDNRFNDPTYLAGRYIVFLADKFREKGAALCDFRSVGPVLADPDDISYRYKIDCSAHEEDGAPVITCTYIGDGETKKLSEWLAEAD